MSKHFLTADCKKCGQQLNYDYNSYGIFTLDAIHKTKYLLLKLRHVKMCDNAKLNSILFVLFAEILRRFPIAVLLDLVNIILLPIRLVVYVIYLLFDKLNDYIGF